MRKVIGIIQARMGSTRLPKKMSLDLGGFPIIDWVITRSKRSKLIDKFILATSSSIENDYLIEVSNKHMIESYRGSENNVLSRFLEIALKENADIVVRICADNPLIDWDEIDRIIEYFLTHNFDYAFNHIPALDNNYVDGVGAEVISSKSLYKIGNMNLDANYLEHVTKFIWNNKKLFNIGILKAPLELSFPTIRLDVDTKEDLLFLINNLKNYKLYKSPVDLDIFSFIKFLNENYE